MSCKSLLIALMLNFFGFSAFADSTCPRCLFEFDKDGKVITESGQPEKTFAFPPIKAGFILDLNCKTLTPHISLELTTFNSFALDFGVAADRVFIDLAWEIIPIVKIGPSFWVGYNVAQQTYAVGAGISLLDF